MLLLLLWPLMYCTAAPTGGSDEEVRRKLILPGSSDTFENRKLVKEMLGSLSLRVRNLHRAGQGTGPPTTPIPTIDLGPKSNLTESTGEANPDLAEYMFEGDIVLTPDQAKAIVRDGGASRKKRNCQTNPAYFWNPNTAIPYTIDNSL
ncbi:hypothetical protein TELCIR_00228, partial [Teladorsagia circumcincta]